MSTLVEIEAAARKLPTAEKEQLLKYLAALLDGERPGPAPAGDLSEFSGVIRLREDPLEWQHQVRSDWSR
jgi:hypothetical protein